MLTLVGIGAMRSPRYRPAGLLVSVSGQQVLLDGGPQTIPDSPLTAWLVTDLASELIAAIRRSARQRGVAPQMAPLRLDGLEIRPLPVEHTTHPTVGYLLKRAGRRAVWAPEFATFPDWAAGVDLMFAEAASWRRPIRFAGGVGGHMAAVDVAAEARRLGVRRLVFAHLGRLTIRALDSGAQPAFGEIGQEGQTFTL